MKSYEEMTRCVLAARDVILRKQRKRRTVLLCCLPVVCCAAAALGFRQYLTRTPVTVQQSDPPAVSIRAETTLPVQTAPPQSAGGQAHEPEQIASEPVHPAGGADTDTAAVITEQAPSAEPPHDVPQTEPPQTSLQTELLTEADNCPDTHEYRPWDELAVNQQYFGADIGKIPAENGADTVYYQTAEQEVPAAEVGAYLCEAFMSGYDFYDAAADRYYHCYAKAYRITGREPGEAVAIQFAEDGAYYLYKHDPVSDSETDGLTGGEPAA